MRKAAAYAAAVTTALQGIAASVRIASPPSDAAEKWDAADALAEGWGRTTAAALISLTLHAGIPDRRHGQGEQRGREARPRQGERLLDFLPELELWHSPEREAFVTVRIGGHFENWRVRSDNFSEWLAGRCFATTSGMPSGQALKDALRIVEAQAKYGRPEHPIFLRLAECDGAVFIDPRRDGGKRRAVEVTPQGWRGDRPRPRQIIGRRNTHAHCRYRNRAAWSRRSCAISSTSRTKSISN